MSPLITWSSSAPFGIKRSLALQSHSTVLAGTFSTVLVFRLVWGVIKAGCFVFCFLFFRRPARAAPTPARPPRPPRPAQASSPGTGSPPAPVGAPEPRRPPAAPGHVPGPVRPAADGPHPARPPSPRPGVRPPAGTPSPAAGPAPSGPLPSPAPGPHRPAPGPGPAPAHARPAARGPAPCAPRQPRFLPSPRKQQHAGVRQPGAPPKRPVRAPAPV